MKGNNVTDTIYITQHNIIDSFLTAPRNISDVVLLPIKTPPTNKRKNGPAKVKNATMITLT